MKNVLMCCSTLNTKGGMVSVVKNYLNYKDWGKYNIKFIPTHFDTNKWIVMAFFAIQFAKIWWTVKTGKYEIAHLHTAERGSFWRKTFLMRFFQKQGIMVILHHHAAEFEDFYAKCSNAQKKRVRKALADADVNIVLSERLVPMIKDKEPKAHVEVLYNAVSTYPVNPYSIESKNVLFMGRLGIRKGTFDLIEAIKRLDEKISKDVKFCLCGDVGEEEVKKKIAELGIQHRIAHIGWIDGEQKKEFVSKAMINCLPSYNEGLPMSILETMAAGIPNISTNIASIPEVIKNEENGFLIEPGNVDALTEKLYQLIQNEDLRQTFSKKSFELINEKFSLNAHMVKLKEMYDQMDKSKCQMVESN